MFKNIKRNNDAKIAQKRKKMFFKPHKRIAQ